MAVGVRTELGCSPTLFAAAGYWLAYRLKARASLKLDEDLVCLSTGVVLAAHTLVDRDEFTPYSSGAFASRRLPYWLGSGLQTPGCRVSVSNWACVSQCAEITDHTVHRLPAHTLQSLRSLLGDTRMQSLRLLKADYYARLLCTFSLNTNSQIKKAVCVDESWASKTNGSVSRDQGLVKYLRTGVADDTCTPEALSRGEPN